MTEAFLLQEVDHLSESSVLATSPNCWPPCFVTVKISVAVHIFY